MDEQDCRNCQSWHNCAGKNHFSYGDLNWCPHQVLWILAHIETLKTGRWPTQEGVGSSHNKSSQYGTDGFFVKPIIVIAELEARLRATGIAGKLLKAQAEAGKDIRSLEYEAWEVLMFIAGQKPKQCSFNRWRGQWRKTNYKAKDEKQAAYTNKGELARTKVIT